MNVLYNDILDHESGSSNSGSGLTEINNLELQVNHTLINGYNYIIFKRKSSSQLRSVVHVCMVVEL